VRGSGGAGGTGSGRLDEVDNDDTHFLERQQMRRHVDRMIQLLSERNRRSNITQLLEEIGVVAPPDGVGGSRPGKQPQKARGRAPPAPPPVKSSFSRRRPAEAASAAAVSKTSNVRRASVPPATATSVKKAKPKPSAQQQQPLQQRHQSQLGPRSYPGQAGTWAPQPTDTASVRGGRGGGSGGRGGGGGGGRPPAVTSPKRPPPRSTPTGAPTASRYAAPPWRAAAQSRDIPADPVDAGPTAATLHRPRTAPSRSVEAFDENDAAVAADAGPLMSHVVFEGPPSPAPEDTADGDGRVDDDVPPALTSIYGVDGAIQPESAERGATFEEARVRCVLRA
jgi:hypothetical protein